MKIQGIERRTMDNANAELLKLFNERRRGRSAGDGSEDGLLELLSLGMTGDRDLAEQEKGERARKGSE
jgi:hypothetical protein